MKRTSTTSIAEAVRMAIADYESEAEFMRTYNIDYNNYDPTWRLDRWAAFLPYHYRLTNFREI